MDNGFFVEDSLDEVYKGNFFDGDVRNFSLLKNNKSAEIETAATPVRMHNEVDVAREARRAANEACGLGGNFGVNFSNCFSGKIFGNI